MPLLSFCASNRAKHRPLGHLETGYEVASLVHSVLSRSLNRTSDLLDCYFPQTKWGNGKLKHHESPTVCIWPFLDWMLAWLLYNFNFQSVSSYCESESEFAQLCPTLCNAMECSPPGFYVHGVFQARVLEWVAISFSGGSSRPGDGTRVSRTVGRRFYHLSHHRSSKLF